MSPLALSDRDSSDVSDRDLDWADQKSAGRKRRLSDSYSPSSTTPSRVSAKKKDLFPRDAGVHGTVEAVVRDQDTVGFVTLGVAPWLVASLSTMAIKRPTGIQKACIPEILRGKDCIGGSRTGSGKTVAFAVPILQKWAEDPVGIFAVVLTPTR